MEVGIIIVAGFVIFAFLMATGRLPALLALPLMAAWCAAAGRVPFTGYLNQILLGGAMKMQAAMAVVVFGAAFASVIMRTGIASSVVRCAAELAGERPRAIALVMLAALAFVFMGTSGLGAVIMTGSIALPIMTGAGIAPVDAAVVMLFGLGLGLSVNTAAYGLWIGVFGPEAVLPYYLPSFLIELLAAVLYIMIHVRPSSDGGSSSAFLQSVVKGIVKMPYHLACALCRAFKRGPRRLAGGREKIPTAAFVAPLLPLVFIFGLTKIFGLGKGGVDASAAAILGFLAASVYAALICRPGKTVQLLAASLVEGIRDVAGVIFLFMGIGMVAAAVSHPMVSAALKPFLAKILPEKDLALCIFFLIFAPAALYRGPLNIYGMGAGIAALLMSTGRFAPVFLCGLFKSVGYLQEADPTNSQNVWTAGFVGTDTNAVLRRMLPYSWGAAALMMLYVAFFRA